MAFPTIPTGAQILSALQADTTATRTFPSLTGLTKSSGDLLIAIAFCYQTSTGTDAAFSGWTGSFTEFGDRATSTTMAIGMAYKWSTGSETGTFAVTQAGTITGHCAMIVMAIPGAHASTIPEAGTKVNGTTGAADIASLNPAGWDVEDTLWIVVGGAGEIATTSTWFGMSNATQHASPWTTVTLPADYSGGYATGVTADVAGAVEGAIGFRQLAAASADPAAFAPDLTNARNSALLIAVRPPVTTSPNAEAVAITATSEQPAAEVAPNAEGVAVTAAALDATVEFGGPTTNVDAECATAIVTAEAPSVTVDANAEGVAIAAAAETAATSVSPNADVVVVASSAETPAGSVEPNASAVAITATSETAAASVSPNAEAVGVAAAANDATVTTSGGTNVQAECAEAIGVAQDATVTISGANDVNVAAECAEATATAHDPTVSIFEPPGLTATVQRTRAMVTATTGPKVTTPGRLVGTVSATAPRRST